jgi:two-component system, chemotaxis family, protein-glutamate methylesterase/glutaminase
MAEDQVRRPGHLLVVGGSAGSLEAILKILPALRNGLDIAVIIIVHRKPSNDTILVDLLNSKMEMLVKEAEEKEAIFRGHVYVVPADYHVLIESDLTLSLDVSEKVNFSRPSIDVTFESAADVMGTRVIGILLSGANADGVEGLKKIQAKGGLCIVQEPGSAEVDYMPRQAIQQVKIDKILPAGEIADYINRLSALL